MAPINITFTFAASPLDVRKGFAFPATLVNSFGGYASDSEAYPRSIYKNASRKGRAFPHIGRPSRRLRQIIQNLIDFLRRQILVIIKIDLEHRGRAARTQAFNF